MTDGHENTVGRRSRIVVGSEPVEAAIHTHIPRVTHAPRVEFEIVPARSTTKNSTLFFILVDGMVALLVSVLGVNLAERVLRLVAGLDSHQVADWLRCVRLHPSVAHREIKPAIGSPVETVHAMAEVVEPSVNNLVLVGDIVPVGIT